jgi:hypothetical protein
MLYRDRLQPPANQQQQLNATLRAVEADAGLRTVGGEDAVPF